MNIVAVVKGTNPQQMTIKALELVKAQDTIPEQKTVLIKPNYINAEHPSTGITTDSRVIEGVVTFLKRSGFEDMIIGEGSGHSDTLEAFQVSGVYSLAERLNVEMLDLNRDEFVTVNPPDPLALKSVKVAKTALESTVISVPKLKLHRITGVTLSIKNLMGAMTPKGSMHSRHLSKKIADLCSVLRPGVAVIDGIIAGEGHEVSGNPVEMNLVIAGTNPVAVDAVGAAVMGVPPETVKHLVYAEKKGIGTSDLNQIKIVGQSLERVKKKFRRSRSSRIFSLLS